MALTDTGLQTLGSRRAKRQNYTAAVATEVRVQAARLNVTQAQIGDAIGLAGSGISRRMNGQTPFDVEELAAIAVLLGCEVADFLPARYDGDPVSELRARQEPSLRPRDYKGEGSVVQIRPAIDWDRAQGEAA